MGNPGTKSLPRARMSLTDLITNSKMQASTTDVPRKQSDFLQQVFADQEWNYVKDQFKNVNWHNFADLRKFIANARVAKLLGGSDEPISLRHEDINSPTLGYYDWNNPHEVVLDTNQQLTSQYLSTLLHELGHMQRNTHREPEADDYMNLLLKTLLGK